MGFCEKSDYELFISQVNDFEKMLIDDGVILIKLWFSITKDEQKFRFVNRLSNPLKTWKFSEVDMEGQKRWDVYTDYKEKMFLKTNSEHAPWKIIDSNNKLEARINSIKHVLSKFKSFTFIYFFLPFAASDFFILSLYFSKVVFRLTFFTDSLR